MTKTMEISNLSKSYKNKLVLDHVSFSVCENCITGFIGANGAGKTTLIKSILGLVFPDQGEISVFGMPLKKNSRAIRDRIGIVFDTGYLYEDLSMTDMKKVIAPAYSHFDDHVFRQYMNRFQLNPRQKIKTLSKGMRMKYAIVLALSHHADLLIMDEPTSGLDPIVRREMLEIMREFLEEDGKAVFFSTHITTDLEKNADQIIMLDHGKVLFQEEKDILLEEHRLVQGNREWLTHEVKELLLTSDLRGFHFEGLTNKADQLRTVLPEALFVKPSVEDIMIAYTERSASS